jgi:pSer/pThr/pTyr-binding forkhead associated (FHA) protein
MWKLSIEDDQGQSTIVQLVRSEYSVGRTEENSIRLTERNISRRHAKLVKQGAAWFIDDLGSYNGCFVNGARVVDHHPVNLGDLVQLGDYRLELHAEEGVAVAPPQPVRPRRADTLSTTLNLAAQTDRLVMVVGPTPGREYMLAHAPQRMGRGEECDICVNHSSVSRWHADLHYVGSSRYEIIDHGSSNGVRINGVDLKRGLLDARDLIELGDIVLKFIPAGQVYRPSPEESRQLAALLGVEGEGEQPGRMERVGLVWRSLSPATRVGISLLAVVVGALLVFSQLGPKAPGAGPSVQQPHPHQQALSEALALLEQGRIHDAHARLQEIPTSSNLRSDPVFKNIELQWANKNLLNAADVALPLEERRTLLNAVAQATSLDPLTRSKAADALAELKTDAVNVAALPSSSASAGSEAATDAIAAVPQADSDAAPPAAESVTAKVSVAALTQKPAAESAVSSQKVTRRTTTRQSTTSATSPRASPAAPTKTSSSAPDSSTSELATSGNLESQKAARDALRRKVSAGTATDREVRLLRALCRQLGDTTCQR